MFAVKCFCDTNPEHTEQLEPASHDVNSSLGGQVQGPQQAHGGYSLVSSGGRLLTAVNLSALQGYFSRANSRREPLISVPEDPECPLWSD